jgi:hypothetical protein
MVKKSVIAEVEQDSPGCLIAIEKENHDQDSRGGLKDQKLDESNSPQETIQEIDPITIQSFDLIPDYISPTRSRMPIVIESENQNRCCVEGWEEIQSAIKEKKGTIRCHLTRVEGYSEEEVAIRKVSIRTMPPGGLCSYAEIVRNVSILFKMLLESLENPIVYSHGGVRKGPDFIKNKKDGVLALLAERLGKEIGTINKYLNYGRYLTPDILNLLVENQEKKAFFETAQISKKIFVKYLEEADTSSEEITEQVSTKMGEMRNEYQATGKIQKVFEPDEAEQCEDAETQNSPPPEPGPQIFNHWTGNPENSDEEITMDEFNENLVVIGRNMIQLAEDEKTWAEKNDLLKSMIEEAVSLWGKYVDER